MTDSVNRYLLDRLNFLRRMESEAIEARESLQYNMELAGIPTETAAQEVTQ